MNKNRLVIITEKNELVANIGRVWVSRARDGKHTQSLHELSVILNDNLCCVIHAHCRANKKERERE